MNLSIFYFLHSFAFQYFWLDKIIWFFAVPFIYIVIILIAFYLFYHYNIFSEEKNLIKILNNKGREIIKIFFSAGFAYIVAYLLKIIIHSDRPFIALSNVSSLFNENGYAFPSGHSATIFALSIAVFFKHKRLGYLCILSSLLIGIARVIAGVHFPIDIIGGYLIGFLVAFFAKSL